MTLLLTGSDETVHGILGAMRYVSTAGTTRSFGGPSADLVNAMAKTFESARTGLAIGGPLLEEGGVWSTSDQALAELCMLLPDPRSRHEAIVAASLCVLMAEDFDVAGEQSLVSLSEAFGVDQEAAALIGSLTQKSAEVAGGDMFRRFLAERSGESLEVITTRMDRLEEPLTTEPEALEAYTALLHQAPAGSVGAELIRFYRHTGYDIPGTPMTPPLEVLGSHDLHHILAGYSTSSNDEVNIAMFTAANCPDGGLTYLAVVLLQWHHDVQITPFAPTYSVLDPTDLAEAATRGATTTFDVSDLSWDWMGIMHENLGEVRRELDVTPGGTVPDGGAWDARGLGDG